MRRFLSLCLVFLLLAFSPASAEEKILAFDSDITVEADGAFLVRETITVIAEGRQIRRGIFRDFPTVFTLEDDKERKVGFDLISVTRNGRPETVALENKARYIRIRIGNRDVMLNQGQHIYEITYRTDRQLRRFDTHDEIFWNVTGNAWAFQIDKATATVRLPEGATAKDSIYFTGRLGSRDKNASQSVRQGGTVVQFITTRPLAKREGLTVGVKFTKGVVPPTSTEQQLRWFIEDNLSAIIGYVGLAIVAFYYLWAWRRVGRDPPKSTIVPRWDLPDGVSPALTNYIYNKGLRGKGFTAISAAALSLAVNGIVELDNQNGTLTIRKTDTPARGQLPVGEASLLDRVDGAGGALTISKGNGTSIALMASKFSSAMNNEHRNAYYKSNVGYIVPGVLLSILIGVLALIIGNAEPELIAFIFPMVIFGFIFTSITSSVVRDMMTGKLASIIRAIVMVTIGIIFVGQMGLGVIGSFIGSAPGTGLLGAILGIVIINALMFFLMGAPTPIGQKRMAEIEGLRHYMSVAEEDRMNMLNSPEMSPQHYETLLPYAVALDCEKPWSRAFQGWLAAAVAAGAVGAASYYGPRWYRGTDSFSPDTIGDTMGNLGSDIANSMTASMPAPKSSSSGFSGGGGGGFSGGGGGGGGGGGW